MSGDVARKFRLQVLNLYAAGHAVMCTVAHSALNTAGYYAWHATRSALGSAVTIGSDNALNTLRCTIRNAEKNEATPLQFVYVSCRMIIVERKKVFKIIDDLNNKMPETSTTTKEMFDVCEILMTFNEKEFTLLKLTIPLKMVDYLLGYERAISFLYDCDRTSYTLLMEKHSQLTRRLEPTTAYTKLTAAREDFVTLVLEHNILPTVLLKIVVGYCALNPQTEEDCEEIYDRLLTFKEFIL